MIVKFVQIFRIWIVLLALAFAITFMKGMYPHFVWIAVLVALSYGLIALVEAFVVGLDTLRGKFILLLSIIGFSWALGLWFQNEAVHLLLRLVILIPVAFITFGTFIVKRIFPSKMWLVIPLLLALTVLIFALGFQDETMIWMDVAVLLLSFMNLLTYWGGEIAKAWMLGILALSILLLADILWFMDLRLYFALWFLPLLVMNFVALKVILEEVS